MSKSVKKEEIAENVIEKFKTSINEQMIRFQHLLNNIELFQGKMSLRTTDLVDMVSIIETLLASSEERFQQINQRIVNLLEQNSEGKKSVEEIVKEFNDLKEDLSAIKHLISKKTKSYTEDVINKSGEKAEEIKIKHKNDSTLLDELTIYKTEEENIMKDLQKYLDNIKDYKRDAKSAETESANVYNQIVKYLKEFDSLSTDPETSHPLEKIKKK